MQIPKKLVTLQKSQTAIKRGFNFSEICQKMPILLPKLGTVHLLRNMCLIKVYDLYKICNKP